MRIPPRSPISLLLGFELTSAQDGVATVRFSAEDRHANYAGKLHGGVLCDIADAAMGNAFRSTLAEDQRFTTVELKMNFLRPVTRDTLTATGRVIRRGRRLGYMECDVAGSAGELVARGACTCIVVGDTERERP